MPKKKRNGAQLALDFTTKALVHSPREKRQAMHIAASERARGISARDALRIGWATVNKLRAKRTRKGKRKMAMPKALAHYWRTHGRGKRRKSSSRSIVVRRSAPVVKVVRVGGATHHKKRHHRRSGAASGGGHIPRNRKAWLAAHGGIIGYTQNVKKMEVWDKIPTVGKAPKELIVAAGLELLGFTRKHKQIDNFATACAVIGGYKAGEEGFAILGDEE